MVPVVTPVPKARLLASTPEEPEPATLVTPALPLSTSHPASVVIEPKLVVTPLANPIVKLLATVTPLAAWMLPLVMFTAAEPSALLFAATRPPSCTLMAPA